MTAELDLDRPDHVEVASKPNRSGPGRLQRLFVGHGTDEDAPRWDRWVAVTFLALALPIGLAYVFLIPPSQVIDERSHFLRTWQLAELNIRVDQGFDENSGSVRNGAVYDNCVIEYIDEFTERATQPLDFTTRSYWFDTPDCSPMSRDLHPTDAALSYGPWSYPGQTVGVALGRVLGLPLPVTFFLGRLVGLLTYVAAVTAALRITPRAKLSLFVVGLLPMSLMTASAFSTDGVMVGGTILAVACALRLALRPVSAPRVLVAVMAASLFLVVATKPNYAVLLALFLLVPAEPLGSKRTGRLLLFGLAVGIVVFAGFLQRALQGAPLAENIYPGTDPAQQLRWMASHPIGFLLTVWRTLFSYTYEVFFLRGWVGVFGMFRTGRPEVAPLLPVPYVVFAFCTAALAVVAEGGPKRSLATSTRLLRIGVSVLVVLGGSLIVFALAFVAWTQPGAPTIEGVQSRYLLPFGALLGGAVALVRHRSNVFISLRAVAGAMMIITVASFQQIAALFY